MRRCGIQVEVVFLHIFAMIAFIAGETEEPLFQDGIAPIPQRQGEAKALMTVADTGNAVFIPAICARARLIMRKVIPGFAIRAVIFAHGAPRALTYVRSPAFPMGGAVARFLKA